jgi:type III secretory pathway component EscS
VKAKSSAVPGIVVGVTFIVTYGWMGEELSRRQRRWWMRQE